MSVYSLYMEKVTYFLLDRFVNVTPKKSYKMLGLADRISCRHGTAAQ